MSSNWTSDLIGYGRERLWVWRVAAIWFLVAGFSIAVDPPQAPAEGFMRLVLAGLLIVQFRLIDDLADRDDDARRHPGRVLVRSSHHEKFRMLAWLMALPAGLLLAVGDDAHRLAVYGGILLLAAILYRAEWSTARTLRNQTILLKYPVFLMLCVTDMSGRALAAALAVYLIATAYDLWTGRRGNE